MTGRVTMARPTPSIAVIEIDNPPVNALDGPMRAQLAALVAEVDADLAIRVVVLTGRGRHFCAGADLKAGGDATAGFGAPIAALDACRVPVIAAIAGGCAGGGLELALACDIRIATPDARFICAGVNMGLIASASRLPMLIGLSAAKYALLTGLPIDAATGERWGLIARIVPAEDLRAEALALAERIATRAPLSVEATKRIANAVVIEDPAAVAREQAELLAQLRDSRDHAAAVAAAMSRTTPDFRRE